MVRQRYVEAVVESARNVMRAYRIPRATVAISGDMIAGHEVYAQQGFQLCRDAGAQVVEFAALLAAAARGDHRTPARDRGMGRGGRAGRNHGMPLGRKAGAVTSTINYEHLWWNVLRADCVDLPLKFGEFATHGRCLFEVAGQPFVMTHGSEVKGQLGIPFYGIRTAWAKHQQGSGRSSGTSSSATSTRRASRPTATGPRCPQGTCRGTTTSRRGCATRAPTPKQSVYFVSHEHGLAEVSYIDLQRPAQRQG